ncbi:MAG: site-specific integrase [Cyanobacteria bacterium J06641_5]
MDLSKVNQTLKSQRVGVSVRQIGQRLYLQATLPPKPNSGKDKPHQQRIALGIYANAAGIKRADAEARKLGGVMALGQFDWADYERDEQRERRQTVGHWVDKYEAEFYERRGRTAAAELNWRKDYLRALNRLNRKDILTVSLLRQIITATPANSCTRQKVTSVLVRFGKFAGLVDVEKLNSLRGNYSARRVEPRDVPEDGKIIAQVDKIPDDRWRFAYGLLATYGLRPHELWHLELDEMRSGNWTIRVGSNTKTGARKVWPYHAEWVDQFSLREGELPWVDRNLPNRTLGSTPAKKFKEFGIPFPPYALRHAYAIRTIHLGIDVSIAAALMGHAPSVHTDVYAHWLRESDFARAFESARQA